MRAGCDLTILALSVFMLMLGYASAQTIDLSGTHAIVLGEDDIQLSSPGYDDSDWLRIAVPSSFRQAGLNARPDVAWYRISFDVPADWSAASAAIRLGIINRSDETYLNGVRIGGTGIIGPAFSDWHSYAPITPRLYQFDPALLNVGGRNVLAIKVAREPYIDDGGIIAGPITLSALDDVLPEVSRLQQRFKAVNGFLFGFESVILVFGLSIAGILRRRRFIQLFMLLYVPYYFGALEGRGVFAAFGWDTPLLQHLANLLPALSIPVLMSFIAHVLGKPLGPRGRALQGGLIVSLITIPGTDIAALRWWSYESTLLWHALMIAALTLMLIWSMRAWRAGRDHATALIFGLCGLFAALFADMVLPAQTIEAVAGIRLGEVGVLCLLSSVAVVVGQRIMKTERELTQAYQLVQTTQEQQSARIARDLHDGIGQWLTGIKINLEMLAKGVEPDAEGRQGKLSALIKDVSHTLEDTRRLAHDLSPALLEHQGLAAAMRSHCERFNASGHLAVILEVQPDLEVGRHVSNQMYRIFQEALSNAAKHSQARRVTVSLKQIRSGLELCIVDNGVGLPTSEGEKTKKSDGRGLGQHALHERARLINGTLDILQPEGGGTEVRLLVPAHHKQRPTQ